MNEDESQNSTNESQEDIETLSYYLNNSTTSKRRIINNYREHILNLIYTKDWNFHEKNIIFDYINNFKTTSKNLFDIMAQDQTENSASDQADGNSAGPTQDTNVTRIYLAATMQKVNLNQLVCKPDTFDGTKPRPREWLEEYEECYQANDWLESTAIKYFPTFLTGPAKDWFRAFVRPKLARIDTWDELKKCFVSYYMGDDELTALKKELRETHQRRGEPSTTFVPKIYSKNMRDNGNCSHAAADHCRMSREGTVQPTWNA